MIFGPKPRDYSYSMPRKAKREAIRNALYAKLRDGEVFFLREFDLDSPSTREAAAALKKLGLSEGTCLLLTAGSDPVLFKSFRNIRGAAVIPVMEANAYHLLRFRNVVFLNDAFEAMEKRLGNG